MHALFKTTTSNQTVMNEQKSRLKALIIELQNEISLLEGIEKICMQEQLQTVSNELERLSEMSVFFRGAKDTSADPDLSEFTDRQRLCYVLGAQMHAADKDWFNRIRATQLNLILTFAIPQ